MDVEVRRRSAAPGPARLVCGAPRHPIPLADPSGWPATCSLSGLDLQAPPGPRAGSGVTTRRRPALPLGGDGAVRRVRVAYLCQLWLIGNTPSTPPSDSPHGRFSPSLGLWSLAALALGLLLGFLGKVGDVELIRTLSGLVRPAGTVWVNALQMTVIPLVVTQLLAAIVRPGSAGSGGPPGREGRGAVRDHARRRGPDDGAGGAADPGPLPRVPRGGLRAPRRVDPRGGPRGRPPGNHHLRRLAREPASQEPRRGGGARRHPSDPRVHDPGRAGHRTPARRDARSVGPAHPGARQTPR